MFFRRAWFSQMPFCAGLRSTCGSCATATRQNPTRACFQVSRSWNATTGPHDRMSRETISRLVVASAWLSVPAALSPLMMWIALGSSPDTRLSFSGDGHFADEDAAHAHATAYVDVAAD